MRCVWHGLDEARLCREKLRPGDGLVPPERVGIRAHEDKGGEAGEKEKEEDDKEHEGPAAGGEAVDERRHRRMWFRCAAVE